MLVDSCWLQTEGVLATSEGVHVLLDNEWVPLPEAGSRKSNNYVWICPICGTTNIHTGLPCSNSENHPDEDEQSEDE